MNGIYKRIKGLTAMTIGLCGIMPFSTQAEQYPSRPITIMVSFTPGGIADTHIRASSRMAEKILGQPIIIENKPGALGTIGGSTVARSKPGGYTPFQATQNIFPAPYLIKTPFDIERDFRFIIGMADFNHVLAVRSDSPYKTLPQLLDAARTAPEKISYGSTGVGGTGHLIAEELSHKSNVRMLHVPFKGAPDAATNLLGGSGVDAALLPDSIAANLGNKVRVLSVFAAERAEGSPDIPTAKEQGYDVRLQATFGLAGPKGMDEARVKKIHDAFHQVMQTPEYKKVTQDLGLFSWYKSSEEYGKWVIQTYRDEKALIERAKIPVKQ